MALSIVEGKSLKEYTSWQVGGPAENYCEPQTVDEIKEALTLAKEKKWPVTLLGGGTNALISDAGIKGLVIHTHRFKKVSVIETDPTLIVEAEAGAAKSEVLKVFMKYRLPPAVFLAGLPGDMGGGVVMNAGVGHKVAPKEFCEIVHSIQVIELGDDNNFIEKQFSQDEIEWHYRKSKNWQPGVITKVRVAWPNKADDAVLKAVREGNKRRKESQPLNMPSCGSVFKNPEGDHAGRLIEATGLKGFCIGGAQVSEKHANFIVNIGGSSATDIHQVMESVQKIVKEKQGIELTNEVVYLGEWPNK